MIFMTSIGNGACMTSPDSEYDAELEGTENMSPCAYADLRICGFVG